MDFIDHAVAREDHIREMQIQAIRNKATERPLQPKGSCHNCSEPFPPTDKRLFCDTDCTEDYEKYGQP